MRIWEQPNHKHYGPVRRLWIMMAQLDTLEPADRAWPGVPWDTALCNLLGHGLTEAKAQQTILYHAFQEIMR